MNTNKKIYIFLSIVLWISLTFGSITSINFSGNKYNLQYSEIILILSIPILIVLSYGKIKLPQNKIILICQFMFCIWGFITIFWAIDKVESLGQTLSLIYGIIAYIVGYNIFIVSNSMYNRGLRIFSVLLVVQLLISLKPFLSNINHIFDIYFYSIKFDIITRVGRSNLVSFYLGFSFLYEILNRKQGWIIMALVFFIGLVLTLSRAGLLSVILALLVWCLLQILQRKWSNLIVNITLISISSILILNTSFGKFLYDAIIHIRDYSSVYSRITFWKMAWNDFASSPILGTGLEWSRSPHNIILELLRDTGLIGFMLFFSIILWICIKSMIIVLKNVNSDSQQMEVEALFIAFLSIILHSMVEPFFWGTTTQILLGLFYAYFSVVINNNAFYMGKNFASTLDLVKSSQPN